MLITNEKKDEYYWFARNFGWTPQQFIEVSEEDKNFLYLKTIEGQLEYERLLKKNFQRS